jgi:hypothetical protein
MNRRILGSDLAGMGPYIEADRIEPLAPAGFESVLSLVEKRSRVSQQIDLRLDPMAAMLAGRLTGQPRPGTTLVIREDGTLDRITSKISRWSFPEPRISVAGDNVILVARFSGFALQQVGACIAESFARRVGLPVWPAKKASRLLATEAGLEAQLQFEFPRRGPARCSGKVVGTAFPDLLLAVLVTRGQRRLLDAVILNTLAPPGRTYGYRGQKRIVLEPIEFSL